MNKRILIVEDSPTQALRAKLLLEHAGFSAEVAEDGKLGLEMALADPPDLVIADITMPVMDGNEMTLRLRNDRKTAQIPILMLTANDKPLDVVRGLEVGADHFITKPYNDDFLVMRVNELFKTFERARQGKLPQQQEVDQFGQKIVITSTREQVLQSLLQTTARIINCQVMALYILTPEGEQLFYPISFAPLGEGGVKKISQHLVSVLNRVRNENLQVDPSHITPIVVEETRLSATIQGDLLTSFLNSPLIVEGQVAGMMGVYSTLLDVFDLQNVGYLFELGQKTAEALSRIQTN